MERRKRRIITGLAATGVLAGALAGGGVAFASTSGTSQPAVTVAAAAPAASSAAQAGTTRPGGTRFLRRKHAPRLVLRTSASYLGLTPEQLRTQLHAGKSLAAVATAQGKSESGLESAIVAAVDKRIDASKLTAARKAAVISDVNSNVDAFVTATHPFAWAAHRLGKAASGAAAPAATPSASSATSAA
jgi:hypothetical protein